MIDRRSPIIAVQMQHLMRVVREPNFKLRIRTAYSIFHAPALGASRLRESRYGRNNRIGTGIIGSWCSFWTPDEALESKDEALHL